MLKYQQFSWIGPLLTTERKWQEVDTDESWRIPVISKHIVYEVLILYFDPGQISSGLRAFRGNFKAETYAW
jgi:hypothetical protein